MLSAQPRAINLLESKRLSVNLYIADTTHQPEIMAELQEIKQRIEELNGLAVELENAQDVADLFTNYWPKVKEALVYIKDAKRTKRRADRKLQKAIDAGDNIYDTLNDPNKLDEAIQRFDELLQKIDNKIDRVKSVLNFIDWLTKEDTPFDNLLERMVEFLNKVDNVLEIIDEKLEAHRQPA